MRAEILALALCMLPALLPAPVDAQPSTAALSTGAGAQISVNGDFTVATTDCGATFIFSSTSQATVSAAKAVGFPAKCRFAIINVGVYGGVGTARGLMLTGIADVSYPIQDYVLYPNQRTEFTNIGGTWVETGFVWRQIWKPPVSVTFFVDAAHGSDMASDGLGPAAGANATLGHGFFRAVNKIDGAAGGVRITFSTTGAFGVGDVVHMAGPVRAGAGHAAFVWNGNGTTIVTGDRTNPCLATYDKAWIEVIAVTCHGAANNVCFQAMSGSHIFFLATASTCVPGTSGFGFNIGDPGSKIEFVSGGFNFGAPAGGSYLALLIMSSGAFTADEPQTFTFLGDASFSLADLYAQQGAQVHLTHITFNLNSHKIIGKRYVCSDFSMIFGTGGSPNTVIPGSVNGTTGSDCRTP